jgi:hypothetical protein
MAKDFSPDLPDDVAAELRRLTFHVVGETDDARLSLPDEDAPALREALEQRVEELIVENGWEHLRVTK